MPPTTLSRRRTKQVTSNLIILTVAVLTALLLLELVMRMSGMLDPIIYRPDPVFGYEPRPNQSATRLGVPIYINNIGLRDNEADTTFLNSKTRILVIGNSVTYGGSRTRQHDLFTEVLERELQAQSEDVKVMNAGVNGYSVSQMLARTRTLLPRVQPTAVVLFAIRGDFLRPPVQFIQEGNFAYPMHRPASALLDFLKLALGYLERRHHVLGYLPRAARQGLLPTPTYVPPYDTTNILDTHLAAFEDFVRTAWEPGGRSRRDIIVFLSPTKAELLENRVSPNADLIQRFARMGIGAYDLQRSYYEAIVARGTQVQDYYFDEVHYLVPGHALAGHMIAAYLLKNDFAGLGVATRPSTLQKR